jgi:hypothetical protein
MQRGPPDRRVARSCGQRVHGSCTERKSQKVGRSHGVLEIAGFLQYWQPSRQVVGYPAVVHRFTKPRRCRPIGAVMGAIGGGPPTAYSLDDGSAATLHGPYPSVVGNRSDGSVREFPEHADGHAVALRHDHATRQATLFLPGSA